MNIRLGLLMFLLGVMNCVFSQKAIDFSITDSKGNPHQLSELLSQGKYVVLEVFHSFSPESNTIAYEVQKLYEEWGNGEFLVEFLAMSSRDFDDNNTINSFLKKYRSTFPHAGPEGNAKSVVNSYTKGPWGNHPLIPSFFLITPDSLVITDIRGSNSFATIDSIDQALQNAGAIKPYVVKGSITVNEKPLERVQVRTSDTTSVTTAKTTMTDEEGEFILVFDQIPKDEQLQVLPSKNDDHDNGVSTFDLVFIIKHIIGSEKFDDPLKYIAADANRNGSVSATDVVEVKKLILLIDTAFKNNTSWRFIPKSYIFNDPSSPLDEDFPEYIPLENIIAKVDIPDFIGIKIGDVTFSAKPTLTNRPEVEQRTNSISLSYSTELTSRGAKVHFFLDSREVIYGFQLSLGTDDEIMHVNQITSSQLPGWDKGDYFEHQDKIKISYVTTQAASIRSDEPLFTLELTEHPERPLMLYLDEQINAEVYNFRDEVRPISLNQKARASSTTVSPNPSITNEVVITSQFPDISSVQVYNLNGAILQEYKFEQVSQASLKLPNSMNAGTYHLKIEKTNGSIVMKRLVKI